MKQRIAVLKKNSGFTLIEIVVYSGIVTGFITTALLSSHQIIQYSSRLEKQRELNENKRFLLQKIQWVLNNAQTLNSPALGASSTSFSVTKNGFSQNPIIVKATTSVLEATFAGGVPIRFSNRFVTVASTSFEHVQISSQYAIRVRGELRNGIATTSLNATLYFK